MIINNKMTTHLNQDNNPSSVKKFTYVQLSNAFVKLSKHPKIQKQNVPDIVKLPQDIRKIATWRIDSKYDTVEGIGDLTKMIVKIMVYSKTSQPKSSSSHVAVDNSVYITEVQKKLDALREQLRTASLAERESLEEEIWLKSQLLKTFTDNTSKSLDAEKEEFTQIQIGSIAKRVFDHLSDPNTVEKIHRELEYAAKPKVDHAKESTGGDYILRNSTRDRRFVNDNKNWLDKGNNNSNSFRPRYDNNNQHNQRNQYNQYNQHNQHNQHNQNNEQKSCYVAPSFRQDEPISNTVTSNRTAYVPPHMNRNSNNKTYENQDNIEHVSSNPVESQSSTESRYKTPYERLHGHNGNNSYSHYNRYNNTERPERFNNGDRPERFNNGDRPERFNKDGRSSRTPYRPDDPDRFNRDGRSNRAPYRPDDPDRFNKDGRSGRVPYRPDDPNRFNRSSYRNNRYNDNNDNNNNNDNRYDNTNNQNNKRDDTDAFVNVSDIKGQINLTETEFPSLFIQSSQTTQSIADSNRSYDSNGPDRFTETEKPSSISQLINTVSIKKIDDNDNTYDDILDAWLDNDNDSESSTKSTKSTKSTTFNDNTESEQKSKSFASIARDAKHIKQVLNIPAPKLQDKNANKNSDEVDWTNIMDNDNDDEDDEVPMQSRLVCIASITSPTPTPISTSTSTSTLTSTKSAKIVTPVIVKANTTKTQKVNNAHKYQYDDEDDYEEDEEDYDDWGNEY